MKKPLSLIHGKIGAAVHALAMHQPDVMNVRMTLMDAANSLGEILRTMPDDAVVTTKPVPELPKARTIRMGGGKKVDGDDLI